MRRISFAVLPIRDAFLAADFGDAVLAAQAVEDDADRLLG